MPHRLFLNQANKFHFHEPPFEDLMETRIMNVLLISSAYDAFLLEEDGRIDAQIFNEYMSLNLRYPPHFIQVTSAEKAFKVLAGETKIDMIITMLHIEDIGPFDLAKKIKQKYPNKPIVVLTPFSREIALTLRKEDTSAIDYIFCWLGNADILLAIIKLIEDTMNVESDVNKVGVQTILLVEDSIRFYSRYLPLIYKIIFEQSVAFMSEGLNEHQKMLRLRGRPKILLARNYEEAIELYEKYRHNMLGVISDIRYPINGKSSVKDPEAGIKLAIRVKADNKYTPILLQSSDSEMEWRARDIKVGFIDKNSKTLNRNLTDFIKEYFAFGEFAFVDPETHIPIMRVRDLKELQDQLYNIPENSLHYHLSRDHFSKWLNARALFPLGELFKYLKLEDFESLDSVKRFIYDAISSFRFDKGRGIIAKFYHESFDEYLTFTRIGDGSIGGKARGLAFLDAIIKKHWELDKYDNVVISIPRTVVIATNIFDEFMERNNLYEIAMSDVSNEIILQNFVRAHLPYSIRNDLKAFINIVRHTIAVRSSSLLEDSHYQPFAGVYSTYMIPKVDDLEKMVDTLGVAIKSVYASVYFKESKAYMRATANAIDEEKMAIVLQEVCGRKYGDHFYPTVSGVARSVNFYPIEPEKPEDGIANIAFGLGKSIVEGSVSLRFSPKYPKKVLQLSSAEMALRETQKEFYALSMKIEDFSPSPDDAVNLKKLKIRDAEKDNSIKHVASTFDYNNGILRDDISTKGSRVITFANILKYNTFPLADILQKVLKIGQKEMNNPIEIEFAFDLNHSKEKGTVFYLLQIRPIVSSKEVVELHLDNIKQDETIIVSHSALGNGTIQGLYDVVYVKTEAFKAENNGKIVEVIARLNEKFLQENKNYILIGPGRWGSSDSWLGIPVKWAQISAARIIIEAGLDNYRIEPSQGTHFFQNLTSFGVGYFTINPYSGDGFYDYNFLSEQEAVFENEYIRHLQFEKPLIVKIDGQKNLGIIFKPEDEKEDIEIIPKFEF